MSKRTNHGMIFVPLLCFLVALLGYILFALGGVGDDQVLIEDNISEIVDIPKGLSLTTPVPLADTLIFDAPVPSKSAESPP